MALGWYSDTGATAAITTTTVNTEIYAKLDFKQPDVRAVYIDWDDGVSNKTSESNFQWVTTTEPISSVVVPHTYNKTGSTFNPVVQTINSTKFMLTAASTNLQLLTTNPAALRSKTPAISA